MSENPQISASVDLDTSAYVRSIRQGIRAADDFDAALDSLIQEANDAEKQIKKLNQNIDLEIDTNLASLNSEISSAEKLLAGLDTTISPLVDFQISNDAAARQLLEDFNKTLSPTIDIRPSELENAAQLLSRLDDEALSVKLKVDDGAFGSIERKFAGVDNTIDVNTKEGSTSGIEGIETKLDALKKLAIIDIVMQMGEGLSPENIPLLGAAADQDKARRTIAAGTGGDAALASQYAAESENVYASNFGGSRDEVAKAHMETVRLTADETGKLATTTENLGTITTNTFAAATATGKDFNEMLAAADTLVQTGLAPTYEAALDMIVNGFQNGLDKGGDLLDTIKEYSGQFSEMGFTAESFFSVLKGGLEAGAFNTDFVADMVKEFNIRAQAAMTKGSTEFDFFKSMDLLDEAKAYKAGEITMEQFFSGAVQAAASGEFDPQQIFDVFGTKAEDLTLTAVFKLDPAQVDAEIAKYKGTTIEVAGQLGGDMNSSIEAAKRKIESELASAFSTAFDIPGKIQQLSDGVSKMSSLIDLGATIPEAIEVAFQIPGFADTVLGLQSTMGNLGITFMEVAASLLDVIGQGDAAAGVRTTIADQAERQLAFDLKLADDGTDFSNAIKLAAERGVSQADLTQAIVTGGQELINQGDMTGAQVYLDALRDLSTLELSPEMTAFLTGEGIDPTNLEAVRTKLQEVASEQIGGGLVGLMNLEQFDSIHKEAEGILGEMDFATPAGEALAPLQQQFTTAEEAVTKRFENMKQAALLHLPGIAETATSTFTPMQTQIAGVDTAYTTMATGMATDTGVMGSTLATASGYTTGFASQAHVDFAETTVGALNDADLKMLAFGLTVTNTMLQAGEDIQGIIDKLLSIGGLDIALPPIGGGGGTGDDGNGFAIGPAPMSGGQPVIPGQSVGGSIESGTLGKVHAEELLYAGSEDVSVLNRQTSSVIDNALASLVGGGGGGNVTNNYYNNVNVVINPGGAAAMTAALDARAIRGY